MRMLEPESAISSQTLFGVSESEFEHRTFSSAENIADETAKQEVSTAKNTIFSYYIKLTGIRNRM